MAIPTFNAVGFCAHYSDQGDWAFDFALGLSRLHQIRLNVFHFLGDPYDPNDTLAESLSKADRAALIIEREKELRLYYDRRAGDYLDVGFRLCENAEWVELHRCLLVREFQLLVLGYLHKGVPFGRQPIEKFAEAFICPVVLVGPERRNQFYLNSRARMILDKLELESGSWSMLDRLTA